MLSKSQLAKIHILKKECGLSDEEYRAVLSSFGVESSKDLGFKGFNGLLSALNRLKKGIKVSSKQGNRITDAQMGKIKTLLKNLPSGVEIVSPNGFFGKIAGHKVKSMNELTKIEGIRVIDALKRYYK